MLKSENSTEFGQQTPCQSVPQLADQGHLGRQ